MMIRVSFLTLALLLAGFAAAADTTTDFLLAGAWPQRSDARLSDVGRGIGIVFSPDLSVEGNCRFYQALGFACFQDADWSRVLDGVRSHNIFHPENGIHTLILETHGTNGHGLKLQKSYDPAAERSYISVGGLQERLEPDGIRYIVISACNSGRLLRPMIYRTLDPHPGDKLFLPPTCGIINASGDFDARRSEVTVMTPLSSHIESTLAANVRELAPLTRRVIEQSSRTRAIRPPKEFAVSDIVMQILLRDPRLSLVTGHHVDALSRDVLPVEISERLFNAFVKKLNALAAADAPYLPVAAPKPAPKSRRPK